MELGGNSQLGKSERLELRERLLFWFVFAATKFLKSLPFHVFGDQNLNVKPILGIHFRRIMCFKGDSPSLCLNSCRSLCRCTCGCRVVSKVVLEFCSHVLVMS